MWTQAAPETRELHSMIRLHRKSIGYGFGMHVAVKKMTSNIHFEDPFRDPELEKWELLSSSRQNSWASPQSSLASAQLSLASL